jgi:hypothetical protein
VWRKQPKYPCYKIFDNPDGSYPVEIIKLTWRGGVEYLHPYGRFPNKKIAVAVMRAIGYRKAI